MKRIALLALVALVWVCLAATASRAYAPSELPVRVVSYDEGGMVRSNYLPRIEASIRAKQRVVIDGWCASACTYELRNPRACVTPRAQLHFHNSPALPHIAVLPESHWLFQLHPPHVQAQIRARGGLTHAGFTVSGPALAAFAPTC